MFMEKNVGLMMEIYQARTFSKQRIGKKSPSNIFFLICSLSASHRRCMDPVDYVYGVLGMFQFQIPRMSDPNAVWQRFLSELKKYIEAMEDDKFEFKNKRYKITASDSSAYQKDLREAEYMSDVYNYVDFVRIIHSDSDSDSGSDSDSE